jgi:ferredoxin/flavodoxin---NADP+ reductase
VKTVFVVGAGPAGLFAAQEIAKAGHQVCIFNRDIKPGGLAEYGIYLVKDKIKGGMRKQFAKIFAMPNIHYFGHVKVTKTYGFSIEELQAMNPDAMMFACGAQGYNKLGLAGEDSKGVYAAKDFVYYYNQLPPYASMDFSTGKRIAVVGMGNVAVDIIRWLLQDSPVRQTEEVIVVARRGPLEAKFGEKEIAHVDMHINRDDFAKELARVQKRCAACNQDVSVESVGSATFPFLLKAGGATVTPKLTFRFLSSPKEIIAGPDGRIQKLVITENDLVLRSDGTTKAKATDQTSVLDIDTMIFAIGDKHDPEVGLPMGPEGYATQPSADPNEAVYQVWDPVKEKALEGFFVTGWARRASTGLVGIARHDGEVAAHKLLEYVQHGRDKSTFGPAEIETRLKAKGIRIVTKSDLELLGRAEASEAQTRNLSYFKYSDDDSMFQAIDREKTKAKTTAAVAR